MRRRADEASGRIWVDQVCVSFQRSESDPRPTPALGAIPVVRIARFPQARAFGWERTAFLIHLPEGEALWIGLGGSHAGPTAVRVRLDALDGLTGHAWQDRLSTSPQNYAVWPSQPWIEGIYRNGSLHSRFSLAGDSWRLLELSLVAPRSWRDRTARVRTRTRPLVLHDLGGDAGESIEPGALIPDRTGIRWAQAAKARVRIYVAAPSVYRKVTGLPTLPPVGRHERYRGERLP